MLEIRIDQHKKPVFMQIAEPIVFLVLSEWAIQLKFTAYIRHPISRNICSTTRVLDILLNLQLTGIAASVNYTYRYSK